jgi:hypothetical protein
VIDPIWAWRSAYALTARPTGRKVHEQQESGDRMDADPATRGLITLLNVLMVIAIVGHIVGFAIIKA